MPKTHPGELRQQIDIMRMVSSINKNGYPETRDEVVCQRLWAAASDANDQTVHAADSQILSDHAHFTIRHRSGIEVGMVVVFAGQRYEIMSIDNGGYRRDYLTLKAKHVKAVGG